MRNHMSIQSFPPRHVHFIKFCHTCIDFSRQNPEGAMLWFQNLCGNSVASSVQWRSYKTCFYHEEGSDTMLNFWTIDLQENECNWEVGLCSGISRTMYIEQDKFETNLIRIDHLITKLIFIIPAVIQWCYNKNNSNHVDKIRIYQLNLIDWLTQCV